MNNYESNRDYRWLFLDLNSYFASVEQQDNPELRGKPIAVVPSNTNATCAIAASYEAKAFGIKTGTKIYEAKQICPDLICVLARHNIYIEYHHKILKEIGKHIEISKICSVDEVACELAKNERCEKYITNLANEIKKGIHDNIGIAINCSIGIAPNAFLAKIASDMQKPDGFTILTFENMKEKLFRLPLRDLTGIGKNMEIRLFNSGIDTIEKLWNIQPKHARKIWRSVSGERFWYKLHGFDIPDLPTTKRMVGHSRMLDPDMREIDKAYSIALNLTIKAAARLRRYDLYGQCFGLQVKTLNQIQWARQTTFSPSQDNFIFTKSLKKLWDFMVVDVGKVKLLKISIMIVNLCEKENITLDLFDNRQDAQKTSSELSIAMDIINKKYGSNTVNLGVCPKTDAGYLGTKIAFNRIPDIEEFSE